MGHAEEYSLGDILVVKFDNEDDLWVGVVTEKAPFGDTSRHEVYWWRNGKHFGSTSYTIRVLRRRGQVIGNLHRNFGIAMTKELQTAMWAFPKGISISD